MKFDKLIAGSDKVGCPYCGKMMDKPNMLHCPYCGKFFKWRIIGIIVISLFVLAVAIVEMRK